MLKKFMILVGFVLFLTLVAGCEPEPPEEPVEDPDYYMGYVEEPLAIDGSSEGYPSDPVELEFAVVFLAYDEQYIYVYLEAEGEGWVSAGFNQDAPGKDGANLVIGFLTDGGTPAFSDEFGEGNIHFEADDAAVNQFYFSRSAGLSIFEFSYPLVFPAGEGYNIEEIAPGEIYSLLVAVNTETDDIEIIHTDMELVFFQVQP